MRNTKPSQSLVARQLGRVLPIAGSYSRPSSWTLALTMAAAILLFQYIASPAASVVFLYLLLAAQSVWFLGGRAGLSLTAATVIAGAVLVARGAHGGILLDIPMQLWNVASRLLSVGLIGFVLIGLRSALQIERWRASTDHLTGALNRAAFDERLEPAMRAAGEAGEAIVLAYIDLDGFKGVNDRHGHAAGNQVLKAFAGAAHNAIRADDIFARIGGDEFAALLCVPSAIEGDRVAELLHHRLSLVLGGTGYSVTCSMGALVMDARQMAREETIVEQADLLMYIAKQAGKNALRIGRGEAAEALLRASFPPAPAERAGRGAKTGATRWIDRDRSETPARKRA